MIRMLVLLIASNLLPAGYLPAADRPNIVMLLADDQCKYSMGCYDTPSAKTPNLDQLARDGMVFDRHYDSTAICMASRATIFTGMYEYKTGCNFESGHLLRDIWRQSYPMLLKQAGYRIAFAGKFGVELIDAPGQKQGQLAAADFDSWGGGPGQTSYETHRNDSMKQYAEQYPHSTLSYGAFARDFIKSATSKDDTRPFCLSISFKAPHHPTTPDPRFDHVYQGATIEMPANFGREHGSHFPLQSQAGRQFERFESWHYNDDYNRVMATYYQQIYAIDVVVGSIRQVLQECGAAQNTVILYSSDNGFLCGSHGYGSKVLPYEESSCVPMIVYDPRHPSAGQQQRCDALTCNADIAATILALADQPIPSTMDGRSLIALLDAPDARIHEFVPLINVWGPRQVHSFSVVTNDYKYVYWPFGEEPYVPAAELYDMQRDRSELHNLIDSEVHQTAVRQMRSLYDLALDHWISQGVTFHGYPRFAKIFDPEIPWSDKP
ncbi:MAG: sulfatase-like hydrolase/transferase [Planctomycetales bacterium]|nr:sulfatase-like hydrolase/transferase [Planctomycetales bacterium]